MKLENGAFGRYLFLLLFLLLPFGAIAQTDAYRHTVAEGETLFRISKQYGVTVEQILNLNPGLTAETLKSGATVLVPAGGAGLGPAGTNCRTMHKVKKKETLWSIAQQYGLKPEELLQANPDIDPTTSKLKKGSYICIPYVRVAIEPKEVKAVGYNELKLAVILPLKGSGEVVFRSIEYYRGLLMAADRMKQRGRNITIYAYDEPASSASIASTLQKVRDNGVQLVVGPLYPGHFDDLSRLTKEQDIKWMVPFSSKVAELSANPQLFLVNAPEDRKVAFAADLFHQSFPRAKVVFLHSASGNEAAFVREMRSALVRSGHPVADLYAGYTAENMKNALAKDGEQTVFVPDANDRSGANAVLKLQEEFRSVAPSAQTALFAYPEWISYASELRSAYSAANTYLFTNFFTNPYDTRTKQFESGYRRWFGAGLMDVDPRMGLLGYDTGLFMMEGLMTYGKQFAAQELAVPLLQSDLHFVGSSQGGGYVNDCMQFIHYRRDGVIEKLSPAAAASK